MDFGKRLPYRYVPPRPRPWLARAVVPYIRHRVLKKHLDLASLDAQGGAPHRALQNDGHSLVITSNHPHPADGWSIAHSLAAAKIDTHYVSDYANFELESRASIVALQAIGTFSINPHDFDPQSFEESLDILANPERRRAVFMFPEGDIYMHNDVAGTFRRGAFFLTIRAARQRLAKGSSKHVYVSPLAIKFTHMTDPRTALEAVTADMQDNLQLTRETLGTDPLPVLRRLAVALANHSLAAVGFAPDMQTLDDLPRVIADVLGAIEETLDIDITPSLADDDRVLGIRRAFYRQLNHGMSDATALPLSERINLAERLVSYLPGYACEHPTVDRISEVVANLYEDLHNEMLRLGQPKAGILRFADPIDVAPLLKQSGPKKKAINDLATLTRQATQATLDQINAHNPHPGKECWN